MTIELDELMQKTVGRRDFIKKAFGGAAVTAFTANGLNAAIYERLAQLEKRYHPYDAPDGAYWDYVAEQFMLRPGLIMMNNGQFGTMPRVVYNTIMEYFKMQAVDPHEIYYQYRYYHHADVQRQVAEFIGASYDEVALVRNSTEGLNNIAYGLDLKPGDEVLMSNFEHPAGIGPWKTQEKRIGIKIREAKLAITPKNKDDILNAFNDAITPRTRIILVSHPIYKTGLIPPVKELARLAKDKNVLIAADGAHCVGMLDLDMHDLGVDFYVSSAYKWMGAPTGCGIFYVRKEVQDILWPNIVHKDWEGTKGSEKYGLLGTVAKPLIIAMGEAVRFQINIGKKRIERRIKTLASYLKENADKIPGVKIYTPLDSELSGGITVLGLDNVRVEHLVSYMQEKHNLLITPILRDKDAARICTHIWISFKQIDILLNAMKELKASIF